MEIRFYDSNRLDYYVYCLASLLHKKSNNVVESICERELICISIITIGFTSLLHTTLGLSVRSGSERSFSIWQFPKRTLQSTELSSFYRKQRNHLRSGTTNVNQCSNAIFGFIIIKVSNGHFIYILFKYMLV